MSTAPELDEQSEPTAPLGPGCSTPIEAPEALEEPPDSTSGRRDGSRQRVFSLLGAFLAFALVFFLIDRSGLDLLEIAGLLRPDYLLAAGAALGFSFFLSAVRWWLLLRHIQVALPFTVVLRLALIGLFFNLLVPGGVGGDLIKAVYLRREARARFPQGLLTVLLDRLFGLAGVLIICLVGLLLGDYLDPGQPSQLRTLMGFVIAVSGASLMGLMLFLLGPILLARWAKWAPVSGLAAWAGSRPEALKGPFTKVFHALGLVRSAPGFLLHLTALSVVVHLCASVAVIVIAWGLALPSQLSLWDYTLATQLGNLVAAIPLTPGGVGGRDLTIALLLSIWGAPADLAAAVPLVLTALMIAWALIGGLALLWERRHPSPGTPR